MKQKAKFHAYSAHCQVHTRSTFIFLNHSFLFRPIIYFFAPFLGEIANIRNCVLRIEHFLRTANSSSCCENRRSVSRVFDLRVHRTLSEKRPFGKFAPLISEIDSSCSYINFDHYYWILIWYRSQFLDLTMFVNKGHWHHHYWSQLKECLNSGFRYYVHFLKV